MKRIKQNSSLLYSMLILLIIMSGTLLSSGNALADTEDTDKLLCPPPAADFIYKITPDCDSAIAEFTDLSTGTITTRAWDFGDGTTSSLQNPVHIYFVPNTYTVTLIVTGPYGADTVSKPVTVTLLPYPKPGFLAIPDSGSVPLRVNFVDRSSDATSILWRFGDGNTSTARDPIHIYTSPGTYTAWQIVTNICGPDSTWEDITVTEPPHADFGYPDTICIYDSVQFKDLSTGYITNWFWTFGDGSTSNAQNPWHTYTALSSYNISLTVTGPGGSDDTTKYNYILVIGPPTSGFTAVPDSGNAPLTVNFTDNSSGADTVIWRFGDGDTSIAIDPSHTYRQVGTYTAQQIVANRCGRDSTDREIKVTQRLHADFGYPDTVCVDKGSVQFKDLSTGNITNWFWDFGDGGTSTDTNPTHTYTDTGTYDVSLAIFGPAGSDDTIKYDYIKVIGLAEAGFTVDKKLGRAPLTIQFTNQALLDTVIIWDFDDGTIDTVQSPVPTYTYHTYTSPGKYWAKQKVENECCDDWDSVFIEVIGLVADFEYPDTICLGDSVQFFDRSTPAGAITDWLWDFGDGNTSTEPDSTWHTYTAVGFYDVSLTVTDPLGSDDTTKTDYILVIEAPIANFIPRQSLGPEPLTVRFTNLSTGLIDSTEWDFGDGTTDTTFNPTHVYTDTGTYDVILTVSNMCGPDTAMGTVKVDIRTGELTISKLVDKPFAEAGEVLTYFVALTNTGDETIYNVEITDTIPDTTVFVTGSAQDDPAYVGDAVAYHGFYNNISWSIDSIVIGQQLLMQFQVTVDNDAPNGYVVVNRASIIGPPPYEGWAEAQTTILAPEITLTKEADPTIAKRGDTVRYTVRAYNNGDSPVLAAYLVDDIPDVFDYIVNSCEVNNVAVTPTGADTLNIIVGDIGIDDSVVITYLVEITSQADTGATYRNYAMLYEGNGGTRAPTQSLAGRSWGPVWADVSLITPPLLVEKRAGKASALPGDIVPYLITVTNNSPATAENLVVIDTMPSGFIYIPQTSVINDLPAPDPVGDNPLEWSLGDLASGESVTIMYAVQISTQATPGINDNVVWAFADLFRPSRAEARVMILSQKFDGTIRGRLIVDCDGDFNPDTDEVPVGVDIYLDDGYQSRSNEKGMFYFSAVRAGEHAVKIDKRDLKALGYHLSDGQTEAVFCHVHELGESYIIFRVCPDQPVLSVLKEAAILPRARVTKTARIDTTLLTDTTGITVDYDIDIESNGGADPTLIKVVDSLPADARLIEIENQTLIPIVNENTLRYDIPFGRERIRQSARYSLEDLTPGVRRFLTNKIHLEGGLTPTAIERSPLTSSPTEVAVGPLRLMPPVDMSFNIIGAYFETAKAELLPDAIPLLTAVADSIKKYENVEVKAEGHCDYRRVHIAFPSNWELSFARAKSVVDWLADHGIDTTILSYEGFAATRPVDTGHTPEAWARNRRVEVFIKGIRGPAVDMASLPANQWQGSTLLELNPVNWDTVMTTADGAPIEQGFNDTWEVRLVVENTGAKAADKIKLTDPLPIGVEYISGSGMLDSLAIAARVDPDNQLILELGPLAPGETTEIRYRIRATSDKMPKGGGAAVVKSLEPSSTSEYKSNRVLFK